MRCRHSCAEPEPPPERDWSQVLSSLSLEYGTLREELLERTARRTQTAGFLTASAAVLVALASTKDNTWVPLLMAVAGVFVILAALTWWGNGRTIRKLSAHVAQLECDINAATNGTLATTRYLRWESEHQDRNLWFRLWYGQGQPPAPRRESEDDGVDRPHVTGTV
jgi:hypothetical protein